MSFRPENEARGEGSGGPFDSRPDEGFRASKRAPAEERRRGWLAGRPALVLIVGLLLLLVGAFLLWLSYGDRAGGTSIYEDSVESGSEPVVRLTNGPGQVRVEGVEGLENVEITAKRYARGLNPGTAKENAANVPVDVSNNEDSILEISTDGGRGTGADYDLKVPSGSAVEIESEAGDVEVSGLTNDATIHAEGGDVTVSDVRGSITIEAPQGDVAVDTTGTETSRAEITVGVGDLDLEDLVVGLLEARVESGDVALSGHFSGGGKISVETGSINVRLPSEDARELDLEARVGEVVRDEEQE